VGDLETWQQETLSGKDGEISEALRELYRDGQAGAALESTTFKHVSTSSRGHAGTKAVFSGAFNFFGLPSTFNHMKIITWLHDRKPATR